MVCLAGEEEGRKREEGVLEESSVKYLAKRPTPGGSPGVAVTPRSPPSTTAKRREITSCPGCPQLSRPLKDPWYANPGVLWRCVLG